MDTVVPTPEWITPPLTIESIVRQLGISGKYAGFSHLIYAVELVLEDPSLLQLVTKALYPAVAAHFGCNYASVERSIRTVAEVAWNKNPACLKELAGFALSSRPTCTDLIDIISNYFRRNTPQER